MHQSSDHSTPNQALMKYLKPLSWLAIAVTIAAVAFSLQRSYQSKKIINPDYVAVPMTGEISNTSTKKIEEHRFQEHRDGASEKALQQQPANTVNPSGGQGASSSETGFAAQTFWIKLVFSGIFCVAGLYVVLSQKYDDETKKWAFSVLSLIAGVWIGTIT